MFALVRNSEKLGTVHTNTILMRTIGRAALAELHRRMTVSERIPALYLALRFEVWCG